MKTDRAELARADWRRSTRSGASGNCVEVTALDSGCAVRDSKNPFGPVLTFTEAEWIAFVAAVHNGEFD